MIEHETVMVKKFSIRCARCSLALRRYNNNTIDYLLTVNIFLILIFIAPQSSAKHIVAAVNSEKKTIYGIQLVTVTHSNKYKSTQRQASGFSEWMERNKKQKT